MKAYYVNFSDQNEKPEEFHSGRTILVVCRDIPAAVRFVEGKFPNQNIDSVSEANKEVYFAD